MMKKWLAILIFLFAIKNIYGQVTIIFNTSFEIDSSKYCSHSTFMNPPPYDSVSFHKFYSNIFTALNTPDIYSPCDSFVDDVGQTVPYWNNNPNNITGFEYAHTGNNYIGLITYEQILNTPPPYYREWVGISLNNNLKINKFYKVEIYISLAENSSFFTPPPQIYFSSDSIYYDSFLVNNDLSFINYQNILHLDTNLFNNPVGWTKFSGIYLAKGYEDFLYMGNFYNNIDTHFEFSTNNQLSDAYYYIDDLTVYELDSTVSIDENILHPIRIYPNPSEGFVNIDLPENYIQAQLSIYNLTGQLISQKQITLPSQQIPITELGNGMYIFVIQNEDKIIGRQRVVVAR